MARQTWQRTMLLVAALVGLAGCNEPNSTEIVGPVQLAVVSGDGQSGAPGQELPEPLVVRVESDRGRVVKGQIVNFRVVSGGGSTFAGVAITNAMGIARERWTLGNSGVQRIEARALDPETGVSLTFAVFNATLLDQVPPVVSNVVAVPNPANVSADVTLTALATDPSAVTSGIADVQYNIDGGAFAPMTPTDGAFGDVSENARVVIPAFGAVGTHALCVRARDGANNTGTEVCRSLGVVPLPTYTIGGTVSGLTGTLVLRNNGDDDRTITTNGSYAFATALTSGSSYSVTVQTQPSGQTCLVANGSGVVPGANVTSVNVTCTANGYTIGGNVTGLLGVGCSLRLNGGAPLSVTGGSFTFPTPLPSGSSYSVTVASQPVGPIQTCTISNGSGTVGLANVTNVGVSCSLVSPSCASAVSVGSMAGDEGAGFVNRTGNGEAWYRLHLTENSSTGLYLSAAISLSVPAGVDYDLYVYCGSCGGNLAGSSTGGTGTDEQVLVRWEDDFFTDESADIYIQVRYYQGSSASNWSLTINGNVVVNSTTCDF